MLHHPSTEEADLHFDQLMLQDFRGTWGELLEKLRGNYARKITQAEKCCCCCCCACVLDQALPISGLNTSCETDILIYANHNRIWGWAVRDSESVGFLGYKNSMDSTMDSTIIVFCFNCLIIGNCQLDLSWFCLVLSIFFLSWMLSGAEQVAGTPKRRTSAILAYLPS